MTPSLPLTRPHAARLAAAAIWLATCAQAVVAYLTFGLAGQVDPMRDPVSDYVFHRIGKPLFVVAVLMVLTCGAALATAAHLAGVPRTTGVTVLFGLWAAGLVVVLLFQGNVSAADPTVQGEIHKGGGAVLFTSLPLACWALARALRRSLRWTGAARRLGWCAAGGFVTAAAFGLAQFVPVLPEGLLERVALTAELVILVTAATIVRRPVR